MSANSALIAIESPYRDLLSLVRLVKLAADAVEEAEDRFEAMSDLHVAIDCLTTGAAEMEAAWDSAWESVRAARAGRDDAVVNLTGIR